jgi:hypothetical protein
MTMLRRSVLLTLTVALLAPMGAGRAASGAGADGITGIVAGATSPATPAPSARPAAGSSRPLIWLRGPFGRVLGGTPDSPAVSEPGGRPLDAYVRGMPMLLEARPPEALSRVEVTARTEGDRSGDESLPLFGPAFEGPRKPGERLLIVSVRGADGSLSEHAWRLLVPDREAPEDGIFDIPAPSIVVSSASGSVTAEQGQGCYVYLCVEVGRPAPDAFLPVLFAGVGETLSLETGDGSGMVAWDGWLRPMGGGEGEAMQARGAATEAPAAVASLDGLAPPSAGEWVLELMVTFDRERGWLRTANRVLAE